MRVSLFITCLADTFYPRAGIALVKVLERLGCEVVFPAAQTCCGQPMYNNGFHAEAATLARRMIDVFEGEDPVVTPSGSCAAMIHDYYPTLLADDAAYARAAKALAARTFEFTQFLTQQLKVDLKAMGAHWPGRVTYHYSCHLRGIGVTDQTPRLLAQIDDIEYTPLPKAEQCCGFGGTFATKFPQISGSMVRDKVACIEQTGTDVVVCNDAGCTMNISGACRRHGKPVRFISLAEIIAESLGLLEAQAGEPADAAGMAAAEK